MTETKAAHTPGPWNDNGLQGELDDDRDIQIGSDHGNVAAASYCGAPYNSGKDDEARFATRDANARLIAAAPELLEACETALNALRSMYEAIDDGADAKDLVNIVGAWPLTQLRSVIAKAEGRS